GTLAERRDPRRHRGGCGRERTPPRAVPPRSRGSRGRACALLLGNLVEPALAELPGGVDRRAEVQALVLRLLDEHHGLERVDVVDPLLLALRRDLRLVRPVIELHLRDARDLAHLSEIELDLVEMLGQVYRFEKIDLPADRHVRPRRPLGYPVREL